MTIAAIALAQLSPTWYTPVGQSDDDEKTEFRLKPLDGDEYGELADHMRLENGVLRITAEGLRQGLRLGLVDWRNFTTTNGETLEFSRVNFRFIPYNVRADLVSRIVEISQLSEDTEKN